MCIHVWRRLAVQGNKLGLCDVFDNFKFFLIACQLNIPTSVVITYVHIRVGLNLQFILFYD